MPAPSAAGAWLRRFVLAAFAPMLAACGATLVEKGEHLRGAQPCCADFAAIRYADLHIGETRLVSISSGDPAFQFDSGKSYFAAYALPASGQTLRLTVESYMQSTLQSPTTGDQYLFAPRILLLDAAHRPLRAVEPDLRRVSYVPVTEFGATAGLGWKLVLHEDMAAGDGARYAIVHTTDRLLAQTTTVSSPYSAAQRDLPHSPTGRLRVTLTREDMAPLPRR
jgi:maltose operon protein